MEISQLTLGQLNSYLKQWVGSTSTKQSDEGYTDIDMFNIMAGIPKKVVKKKD